MHSGLNPRTNHEHYYSEIRLCPIQQCSNYVVTSQVLLAEMKGTDQVYAIKLLKKDVIIQDDDVEAAITERNVLTYGSCPFLVELHSSFQTLVCDHQ